LSFFALFAPSRFFNWDYREGAKSAKKKDDWGMAGTFLPFAAEGMVEHDQAPGLCPQRWRLAAFESAPVFGTIKVTDLNL